MIKKAVIPAAGYGTRGLPVTKALPKEMFPIGGRPAIDYIVEEAVQSGIEEILIILSRSKNIIMDYFDRSLELEAFLSSKNKTHLVEKTLPPKVHIQYIRQPYAHGLGAAIQLARPFVNNEPFAVLLPDEINISKKKPALGKLITVYRNYKCNVVAVLEEQDAQLRNYGVISGEELTLGLYRLDKIVEKPQEAPPSNLVVAGRYVLKPDIFEYLEKQKPGINGEIQLTDALNAMLSQEEAYATKAFEKRFDIGKDVDYLNLINFIVSE